MEEIVSQVEENLCFMSESCMAYTMLGVLHIVSLIPDIVLCSVGVNSRLCPGMSEPERGLLS